MFNRIFASKTVLVAMPIWLAAGCGIRGPDRLAPAHAIASTELSSWERVLALDSGANVVIGLQDGASIRGRLSFADKDAIALEGVRTGDRQVSRSDIETVRLRIRHRGSGAKGALIGAAIGGGSGAALAVVISESTDVAAHYTVPVLGAAGAATGALVGYLAGSRRRCVLIYESFAWRSNGRGTSFSPGATGSITAQEMGFQQAWQPGM